MKPRLILAAALVGGLSLSVSGAQAATPTLDGKKVKVLTVTGDGGAQAHDADNAALESPDRTMCTPDRCTKLPFVYKPAKGVKGDLMFTATWSNPAADIDLFVGIVNKDGSSTTIASCGAFGGTQEKVFVPAGDLKTGKKYVMVVDFYRSLNDKATGKVEIGVPSTVKSTFPDAFAGLPGALVNCGQ